MEQLSAGLQPYRGLQSFRYIDRPIYAGRDIDISKLFDLVLLYRGIIVYGISGIGKSSLMGAGLIPELIEEGGFHPEIIRVYPSKTETFSIKKIRNSEKEYSYFQSIFDEFWDKTDKRINVSLSDFRSIVERSGERSQSDRKQKTPVLIFDQFEELITYFEEADETSGSTAEKFDFNSRKELQNEIITFIKNCIYNEKLQLKLIFTFREDYLAKFSSLFNTVPDLRDHFLRIKPVQLDMLDEILRKPFETKKFPDPFSEELIEKLKQQFTNKYPDKNLDLTEVQIVCQQLYNTLPESARLLKLQEGIDNILQGFLMQAVESLSENERAVAINILSLLVLNEKVRNIYHRDAIFENLKIHYPVQLIEEVLDRLEGKIKIIRKELRKGGFYYEIISEAIIPFINKRKIEIINQKKVEKENKEKYDEEQRRYKEEQHKIREKEQRKIWIVRILMICMLLAGSAYLLYLSEKNKLAELETKSANDQLKITKERADFELRKSEDGLKIKQLEIDRQQTELLEAEYDRQKVLYEVQVQKVNSMQLEYERNDFIRMLERNQSEKKIIDSLNGVFGSKILAEKSLRFDDIIAKKTAAVLAYDTLVKAYNQNLSDGFSPEVYSALVEALKKGVINNRFYSPEQTDYKKIESINCTTNNCYLSRPFVGISDKNGAEIMNDRALIRCWFNIQGNRIAVLRINENKTKDLLLKNPDNRELHPPIRLQLNEDIQSVVFSPDNDLCIYSTRVAGQPGRVKLFRINNVNDSTELIRLQNDEYMFLENGKNNSLIGVTNTKQYFYWDDILSGIRPVAMVFKAEGVVSAITYCVLNGNLYIGTDNGRIYLFNRGHDFIKYFTSGNNRITALDCSLDGQWLGAGSIQGELSLLRSDSLEPSSINLLKNSSYSRQSITALCFSTRSDTLIVSTNTGAIYNFPLSMDVLVNKLCNDTIYLNPDEWQKYFPRIKYRKICER